ncbi:MAG: ammonium transporter [Candidatus Nanopelagicales bacterium]
MEVGINAADTVWVLVCAALVLLMTPGLALFYGGMVRAKSVLNMIMMSFVCMGLVTVLWVLYGYSMVFGPDVGLGLVGDLSKAGLGDAVTSVVGSPGHQIPELAFVMFQLTFAIITSALLSGAIADRAKFGAWLVFVGVWVTLVYFPIAHWAFAVDGGDGGWIVDRLHALDFAGGTAVEITSGASSLALALVLGRRLGWRKDPMRPHNMPLVLLGAGLLWFGWFGFNAGSALTATPLAATAMMNTQIATALGALAWVATERVRDGHATTLGIASGAVAGAVAITPACGFVTPLGAMVVGAVAGVVCSVAVGLKYRFGYDDSLDVVGVHMVGGLVGMLLIGVLATTLVNSAGGDGLVAGGGMDQMWRQVVASLVTLAYAFTSTWLIARGLDRLMGFRLQPEIERAGVDIAAHAESAYDFVAAGGSVISGHPMRDPHAGKGYE